MDPFSADNVQKLNLSTPFVKEKDNYSNQKDEGKTVNCFEI